MNKTTVVSAFVVVLVLLCALPASAELESGFSSIVKLEGVKGWPLWVAANVPEEADCVLRDLQGNETISRLNPDQIYEFFDVLVDEPGKLILESPFGGYVTDVACLTSNPALSERWRAKLAESNLPGHEWEPTSLWSPVEFLSGSKDRPDITMAVLEDIRMLGFLGDIPDSHHSSGLIERALWNYPIAVKMRRETGHWPIVVETRNWLFGKASVTFVRSDNSAHSTYFLKFDLVRHKVKHGDEVWNLEYREPGFAMFPYKGSDDLVHQEPFVVEVRGEQGDFCFRSKPLPEADAYGPITVTLMSWDDRVPSAQIWFSDLKRLWEFETVHCPHPGD